MDRWYFWLDLGKWCSDEDCQLISKTVSSLIKPIVCCMLHVLGLCNLSFSGQGLAILCSCWVITLSISLGKCISSVSVITKSRHNSLLLAYAFFYSLVVYTHLVIDILVYFVDIQCNMLGWSIAQGCTSSPRLQLSLSMIRKSIKCVRVEAVTADFHMNTEY